MVPAMRRISLFALTLLAAGCASTPKPEPSRPTPTRPSGPVSALVGLSANELTTLFGAPRLQVREGSGLKLQWTSTTCVLDAYLYPEGGRERAMHIDTRRPSGDRIDQRSCVATLTR
ncbi:hypothetical protein [Sphingomonas sp. HDW15A]|uniref:hypothetical protein n=1 Tax=Sphingomonas sp. HDW15A TaxID=2714942 RepID=UPI0019CF965F|nr:hypothetical protein [Sphingomonas sp. HDW15A]